MARDVSSLALSLLLGYVEKHRPEAIAELLRDLPSTPADLRRTGHWIDWSTYAEIHHRLHRLFPNESDLFLQVGRSAVDLEAFGFVRIMASLVFDVRAVYAVVQRTVPVFLFRPLVIERRDRADGVEMVYRLRDDVEPLPGFFRIVHGILEQLPRLVGESEAAVEASTLGPRCVAFRVGLPPARGPLHRIRTVAGNYLRWYPRAMAELEETNRRILDQYERLEHAYQEIQQYRTRLEAMVDERTAQLSIANRSLEQSVFRLEALDRAKSEFFANVSHELRTPLTLILGPVSSLLDGSAGPLDPSQRRLLDTMFDHSRRLLRQVNNLLDVAKLEAGHMRLRFEPTDLSDLVEGLVVSARGAAEARRLSLTFETTRPPDPVHIDAEQFEKVVLNILGNAMKFTPSGGRLSVRVDETSGFVRIAVADTGEGIPPEDRDRIFDRFTQVDGSTTRRHRGTGIGLALAREIVVLHAGHIDVESELGRGSVFTVWVPKGTTHVTEDVIDRRTQDMAVPHKRRATDLERAQVAEVIEDARTLQVADVERADEAAEEEEGDFDEGAPDRPRVLVVEDDEDVRRYLAFSLRDRFRVRTAPDGLRGLEAALRLAPDAVVCDVMMPGIDGIELVRRLRADPAVRGIPVLLVTARADPESRMRGLEAGADDYLVKPFSTRELLTRLRNLVTMRASERELAGRNDALERALAELRRAQSDLVAQARMASLGQLVAGVAHELNNPVNFLCGATFAIEEKLGRCRNNVPQADLVEQVRKLASVARVGGERVAEIVESLRQFSGRPVRSRGPADLVEGVRLTLALLEPRIREFGAHLDLELDEPLTVHGNAGEIHQVLMNLLTNALQAAPGGKVEIRGGRRDHEAWVEITDDGPGIPEDILPRIFEPFFTTREPGQGTGLGLSICDTIVRAHGGRIDVRSTPGRGTAFRLVLPAGPPAPLEAS